jgi:hypothetical protein
MGGKLVVHIGDGSDVVRRACTILQGDVHRVDIGDGVLVARVMGALENPVVQQCFGGEFELAQNRGFQGGRAVIQRQLDVGEAQHARSYKGRFPNVQPVRLRLRICERREKFRRRSIGNDVVGYVSATSGTRA